jgi:hypothetical protein
MVEIAYGEDVVRLKIHIPLASVPGELPVHKAVGLIRENFTAAFASDELLVTSDAVMPPVRKIEGKTAKKKDIRLKDDLVPQVFEGIV